MEQNNGILEIMEQKLGILERNMGRSSKLDLLEAALVEVQKVMEAADKSTKGYNYKYAKYCDVVEASRPHLTANGLSIRHEFIFINGSSICRTILAHKSGQWTSSDYPIREIEDTKKSPEQSLGTWISYIKRYQYMCIIGLAVDDESDNDGHREPTRGEIESLYITESQIRLLQNKSIGNREKADQIKTKYNITDSRKILKKDFNAILAEFEK